MLISKNITAIFCIVRLREEYEIQPNRDHLVSSPMHANKFP
jgi:hypothetical protein